MSLYNFTSHTFTNAGATGRLGPKLDAVRSAYSTTTWANTYLNMTNDNGIQLWTVPKTGKYTIEAWGAAGGTNGWSGRGGYGARVSTNVTLAQNQTLAIVIGQQGIGNSLDIIFESGTGGGGGSFVYDSTSITYYVVAGGGGGARTSDTNLTSTTTTADGTTSNNGNSVNINNLYTAAGGVDGGGGSTSTRGILYSGPGAGIDGNGATNSSGSHGKTRLYGWVGGTGQYEGGFGGGGSSKGETTDNYRWGGGGGGYSGGGAGGNSGNSDGQYGGGGGSYYSGLLVSQSDGVGLGHGKVTITVLTSPATLTFLKTAFYIKYLLNSTISIPATLISTNNTDTYTLTHSSGSTGGNTGVATVSTSANAGTVTIKGVGKTTITSTIAATANFDEITTTSITITVIGAGLNLTNEVMTSVDLSETDLTGSVFSGCDLTSANLYGATFNAATDLRGSTLTSLRSGRIIGNTTLLPVGYKII